MSPIPGCPRYKVLHPYSPSPRHRIASHAANCPGLALIHIASGVALRGNLGPDIVAVAKLTPPRENVSMLWYVEAARAKSHCQLPLRSTPVTGLNAIHRQSLE